MMKRIIFSLVFFICMNSNAQNDELNSKHFNLNNKNVAIKGYDAVSYFENKPQKGKSSINYKYKDVIYYFVNENNQKIFKEKPNKFIPKYGGWCAYAMSTRGEMMEVDPKTYKITNGKLYLFYDSFFSSVIDDWIDDELVLIAKANQNWNNIIQGVK